jgi:hydrogenase nickel incorporation protein HypA/HybF
MHEFSLVRALIAQVKTIRQAHGGAAVTSITVSVGELAGVEPALFQSAFTSLVAATEFPQAALELRNAPLRFHCQDCGQSSSMARGRFACGLCGSPRVTIVDGDSVILESVCLGSR